jgi:putative flippase GtrA
MDKSFWQRIAKNQVARFILSAGMGFLVDVVCFFLLFHYAFTQRNYNILSFKVNSSTLSLGISFTLGVFVNFLITKYLVFTESQTSAYKQFFRFAVVATVGFFANLGMIELFIRYFNMYPPMARPLAALSLFFVSYFVHKFFSFSMALRHHQPKRATVKHN